MTLKELKILREAILDLEDFVQGNCDADTSGIYERMMAQCSNSRKIIEKEQYKNHLRNALARISRKEK